MVVYINLSISKKNHKKINQNFIFLNIIEIINARIATVRNVLHAGLFIAARITAPAPKIAANPEPQALIFMPIQEIE